MNERTPIQTFIEAIGLAIWWASGTLAVTWFTSYWLQGIAVGLAIGATLYVIAALYEDITGQLVPCWFGLFIIGPIGPMWAIGGVSLLMWLLGVL